MTVVNHRFGYQFQSENVAKLETNGVNFSMLMSAWAGKLPAWNVEADPMEFVSTQEDQGQIGSCVGNSGTSVVEACYFLKTGRKVQLSRAAGYYLSQRVDGIRGDNGATISGFQEVATKHGLCLESEWPYVARYNPSEPAGCRYDFKVVATKPIKTLADFDAWIMSGLIIHVGLMWNSTCDGDIVSNYNPNLRNSGGHAVMFWNKRSGGNYRMLNSWGNWNKDGQNEWTPRAIETALANRWTVAVGYAPDGLLSPVGEVL